MHRPVRTFSEYSSSNNFLALQKTFACTGVELSLVSSGDNVWQSIFIALSAKKENPDIRLLRIVTRHCLPPKKVTPYQQSQSGRDYEVQQAKGKLFTSAFLIGLISNTCERAQKCSISNLEMQASYFSSFYFFANPWPYRIEKCAFTVPKHFCIQFRK